jgi:RNA polymerase sigma factor (TIGR02999 family)
MKTRCYVTVNTDPTGKVTRLLLDWSAGDESALAALLPLVYEELRTMAARHLRMERQAHTLQRTALVHEAFLRLVDQRQVDWHNRSQFFSLASQIMRRVLVDHARKHLSSKRGGGAERLNLDEIEGQVGEHRRDDLNALMLTEDDRVNLGSIDHALKRLEEMDPRQGKLVELRFFGGLSIEDTAEVLGISPATVKREWVSARAWLQVELGAGLTE